MFYAVFDCKTEIEFLLVFLNSCFKTISLFFCYIYLFPFMFLFSLGQKCYGNTKTRCIPNYLVMALEIGTQFVPKERSGIQSCLFTYSSFPCWDLNNLNSFSKCRFLQKSVKIVVVPAYVLNAKVKDLCLRNCQMKVLRRQDWLQRIWPLDIQQGIFFHRV